MAITEFVEAPTCEERLAAVKTIRELKFARAVPVLQDGIARTFTGMFKDDRNRCLREEANATIAELEKLSQPAGPPS